MSPQLGFHVDLAACSGCKTCQVACSDAHDLEGGRRFRRVVQVEGGEWARAGEAWIPGVFAYSLSISCMHCERPACVDVCPTLAMTRRPDGIVAVDIDRCVGCRYCEWACPYGALRYDERAGRMSKCDFCAADIDRGREPACVASCPMRALDWGGIEELRARHGAVADVYPLPDPSLTRPSVVLTPHRHSVRGRAGTATVSNREEL